MQLHAAAVVLVLLLPCVCQCVYANGEIEDAPKEVDSPNDMAPEDVGPVENSPEDFSPEDQAPKETPETVAPDTEAPDTMAPTIAPDTGAPDTLVPTTAPNTIAPNTAAPTIAPDTRAPPTDAPATPAPPQTDFSWCEFDADCRGNGDQLAVCDDSNLCKCSAGFSDVDGAVRDCYPEETSPESMTTLYFSLRWRHGNYAATNADAVQSVVEQVLGLPVQGKFLVLPGSVVVAGGVNVTVGAMLPTVDSMGAKVQNEVDQNDDLKRTLGSQIPDVTAITAAFNKNRCTIKNGEGILVEKSCRVVSCTNPYIPIRGQCLTDGSSSNLAAIFYLAAACALVATFAAFLCRKSIKQREYRKYYDEIS
ncbi:hypothetical protein DIPPA_20510 [Diplonema papillatum]|nr:hypothetical protein DIPPA_20510 [Diplonema papillatum]